MNGVSFDENKRYDLILLGRVAIDFNPMDYYKTLAESETFRKYVGGSPANIAVGLSRLGKKCGFFAKVSDDRFGEYVVDYFKNEGIDTSHIRKCENGESLGLTFTEILSRDESNILMYRNGIADLSLCPEDIDEEYLTQAKAVLISGTALAASPSREAALKTVALARKNGVRIIFDIDYRAYNWKSLDEMAAYYLAVARDSDIILGSRQEYDLTERFLGLDGTDKASAGYWCSCQASVVVIKHGREGSAAYTDDGKSYFIRPFLRIERSKISNYLNLVYKLNWTLIHLPLCLCIKYCAPLFCSAFCPLFVAPKKAHFLSVLYCNFCVTMVR